MVHNQGKVDPYSFEQKVATTIKQHEMADPRDRVLVAVSGGADSVCLARVLETLGYCLGVAHVNHGLRGADSDADERFVERFAARRGLPFFLKRIRSGELAGNQEAAAREARRSFFRETLGREGFRRVALAHSRDDRTETFLLHLLRGAGTGGLVSMQPASDWLMRPLLETTREEIEAYLEALGQTWCTDVSNRDLQFSRNRVRHEVLPRLAGDFNPRLGDTLSRTMEILSAENDWMDGEARRWVGEHLVVPEGGTAPASAGDLNSPRLDIGDLASRHVALVRRILRAALRSAGSDLRDIGFDHLEQVRHLLGEGKSGKVIELPGSIHVERSFDTLLFRSADFRKEVEYAYELPIPGRVQIPEAGLAFEARIIGAAAEDRPGPPAGALVDGERLGACVKIRNWKNGDTYDPVGLPKSKLKTLFQQKRIPRSARYRWPVCVAQSSIVWVASFPVSRDFAPTEGSRRIIEFEASPA